MENAYSSSRGCWQSYGSTVDYQDLGLDKAKVLIVEGTSTSKQPQREPRQAMQRLASAWGSDSFVLNDYRQGATVALQR